MRSLLLFLSLTLSSIQAFAIGETSSPNMGLIVPAVGITSGPDWATDINSSLGIIDSHNHCSGSGIQIPPCGLNINSDLTFLGNNAIDVNSVVFDSVTGTPSVLAIYTNGTDLFYKDSSGSPIQITKSHGVNVSAGNIQNLPSTPIGGAGISWSNIQATFQFFKDSGTVGANLDSGSLIIRYPGSYPAPVGNFIAIEAPTTLATGYKFTLPAAAPTFSPAYVTSDTAGTLSYSTANNIANNRTRSVASTVGVGGVAISASTGTQTTGTSPINVATITITTSGRPVAVLVTQDGSSSPGVFRMAGSLGTVDGAVFITNDTSAITIYRTLFTDTNTADWRVASSTVATVDYSVNGTPGTYTYTLGMATNTSGTITIGPSVLIAYEL